MKTHTALTAVRKDALEMIEKMYDTLKVIGSFSYAMNSTFAEDKPNCIYEYTVYEAQKAYQEKLAAELLGRIKWTIIREVRNELGMTTPLIGSCQTASEYNRKSTAYHMWLTALSVCLDAVTPKFSFTESALELAVDHMICEGSTFIEGGAPDAYAN